MYVYVLSLFIIDVHKLKKTEELFMQILCFRNFRVKLINAIFSSSTPSHYKK